MIILIWWYCKKFDRSSWWSIHLQILIGDLTCERGKLFDSEYFIVAIISYYAYKRSKSNPDALKAPTRPVPENQQEALSLNKSLMGL